MYATYIVHSLQQVVDEYYLEPGDIIQIDNALLYVSSKSLSGYTEGLLDETIELVFANYHDSEAVQSLISAVNRFYINMEISSNAFETKLLIRRPAILEKPEREITEEERLEFMKLLE